MCDTNELEQFEEYLEEDGKSELTMKKHISNLKEFLKFLNKDFKKIKHRDIEKFKKSQIQKGNSAATINNKLSSIRKYIVYMNIEHKSEISILVKSIKIQKKLYIENPLTNNDAERLVRHARKNNDLRSIVMFKTLALMGLRVSELVNIKVKDILDKDESVVIGKGFKERTVLVPKALQSYISKYVEEKKLKKNDFLIKNIRNGGAISTNQAYKITQKYAGLARVNKKKAHPHAFRHLYCTNLAYLGYSASEIAMLAGHKDIRTTAIYTKRTEKEIRTGLEKLDDLIE